MIYKYDELSETRNRLIDDVYSQPNNSCSIISFIVLSCLVLSLFFYHSTVLYVHYDYMVHAIIKPSLWYSSWSLLLTGSTAIGVVTRQRGHE